MTSNTGSSPSFVAIAIHSRQILNGSRLDYGAHDLDAGPSAPLLDLLLMLLEIFILPCLLKVSREFDGDILRFLDHQGSLFHAVFRYHHLQMPGKNMRCFVFVFCFCFIDF